MSTASAAKHEPKETAPSNQTNNVIPMVKPEGSNPEISSPEMPIGDVQTGVRSICEIIKDLSKPVAKRHLRTRKQGGKELTYISWFDAVKYFDHYAAGWNYEVRSIQSIGTGSGS